MSCWGVTKLQMLQQRNLRNSTQLLQWQQTIRRSVIQVLELKYLNLKTIKASKDIGRDQWRNVRTVTLNCPNLYVNADLQLNSSFWLFFCPISPSFRELLPWDVWLDLSVCFWVLLPVQNLSEPIFRSPSQTLTSTIAHCHSTKILKQSRRDKIFNFPSSLNQNWVKLCSRGSLLVKINIDLHPKCCNLIVLIVKRSSWADRLLQCVGLKRCYWLETEEETDLLGDTLKGQSRTAEGLKSLWTEKSRTSQN